MNLQQACSVCMHTLVYPGLADETSLLASHIVDSTIGAIYYPHIITTPKALLSAHKRNKPILTSTVHSVYGSCKVAVWSTKHAILVYPILPMFLIPDKQLFYYQIVSQIPEFAYDTPPAR